jgi:hypothetical protein
MKRHVKTRKSLSQFLSSRGLVKGEISLEHSKWLYLSVSSVILFQFYLGRKNWFFGDELNWLSSNWRDLGLLDRFFTPWNEHWATISALKDFVMYRLFGAESYLPFLSLLLVFHFLLVLQLANLLKNLGLPPRPTTFWSVFFAIAYFGTENIFWANQWCIVASIWLTMMGVNSLFYNSKSTLGKISVLNVLAIMTTSFSVPFIIVSGLLSSYMKKKSAGLIVTLPSLGLWLVWRNYYEVHALFANENGLASTFQIGYSYFWHGVSQGLLSTIFVREASPIVFICYIVLLSAVSVNDRKWNFALIFAWSSAIFYCMLAYSRQSLGIEQSFAPRYGYCLILAVTPITALFFQKIFTRYSIHKVVPGLISVSFIIGGLGNLYIDSRIYLNRSQVNHLEINSALRIASSYGEFIPSAPTTRTYPSLITMRDLENFKKISGDRSLTPDPSELDILLTSLQVQVSELRSAGQVSSSNELCPKILAGKFATSARFYRVVDPSVPVTFRLGNKTDVTAQKSFAINSESKPVIFYVIGNAAIPVTNSAPC